MQWVVGEWGGGSLCVCVCVCQGGEGQPISVPLIHLESALLDLLSVDSFGESYHSQLSAIT